MKEILVKSVLNKKKKRDSWFLDDYTLNPYEGCSFNCQYCYIRGSKYGENMADTLSVKINGPEVLDRQLAFRAKKEQHGIIALASATDPYIKAESTYRVTEKFLQLIQKYRFPVLMLTKSDGILRDLHLLQEIDRQAIQAADLKLKMKRGAIVSFSISTLNDKLASALEPGAPLPEKRLQTMKRCKEAGLLVGVNCIPTLPFITDSESQLEEMVSAAKDYGADFIHIGGLTLFGHDSSASKTLYYKFLERNYPLLVSDYKNLYRSNFFPPGAYIAALNLKADRTCTKYQLRRSILEHER